MSRKNQQGVSILLYVILVMVLVLLVLVGITPRLLLSYRRSASLSDTILTTYAAESHISNILDQLLLDNKELSSISTNIYRVNDAKISTRVTEDASTQTITVTATRAYAVNRIQAVRTRTSGVQTAEILLSLDCSAGSSITTDETTTPFLEQKLSTIYFLETIRQANFADRAHIGLSVFGLAGQWVRRGDRPLTTESGVPLADYIAAVHEGFGYTSEGSPACQGVVPVSNIGSAIKFGQEYFQSRSTSPSKKIHIVVTDAVPNARDYDEACLPASPADDVCIAEDRCYTLARDYLACKLVGRPKTLYDLYVIVVNRNPIPDEVAKFTETSGLLQANATRYYQTTNPDDPGELVQVFADVFSNVSQILSVTKLFKVIPNPE